MIALRFHWCFNATLHGFDLTIGSCPLGVAPVNCLSNDHGGQTNSSEFFTPVIVESWRCLHHRHLAIQRFLHQLLILRSKKLETDCAHEFTVFLVLRRPQNLQVELAEMIIAIIKVHMSYGSILNGNPMKANKYLLLIFISDETLHAISCAFFTNSFLTFCVTWSRNVSSSYAESRCRTNC